MKIKTTAEIADFLEEHFACFVCWPRARLEEWVDWYLRKRFIATVVDETERLVAVGLGRPVGRVEDAETPYAFDEAGEVFYVESMATLHKAAIPALLKSLKVRSPQATRLAFRRRKRPARRVAVYNVNRFVNLMKGGNNG